ncbi:MAG: cache domain-containing protein [Rhodospirillaceae bacterium]
MTTVTTNGAAEQPREGSGKWWMIILIVLMAGVLSAFYAINEYAAGTGDIVKRADRNAERFEMVFQDLLQGRFRAMNLASEVMLQSRVTVEAFAKGDRDALVARIEPFFEEIHKNHGVAQLNFWTPPATMFYRAGSPKSFGMDLSKFRKSIVAANERRQKLLAVETGLGGLIGVRAISPVIVEDKMVGVLEFVTDFNIPLERASITSGLKWSVGLMKEVSERVERPADPKTDAWKGNDVFFIYSDPLTGELVRNLDFDPRAKKFELDKSGKRTVFVKSFPVLNFSGVPTIVIATTLDVTDAFADILQSVAIKTGILFLVIAVAGIVGTLKFGQMRNGLTGALNRQKAELVERAAACDAAVAKLKDVDLIKRGFFTNLVTAVNEPLQAVSGQLQSVVPTVEAVARGEAPDPAEAQAMRDRFAFALGETSRLGRLVSDYQQLELFRQRLVKAENPEVVLAEVVGRALAEDLAAFRRLPQLTIASAVTTDLPLIRADAGLLRRAVAGLVGYAAQRGGHGKITLAGRYDRKEGWLNLSITGSAFAAAGAPDEALLDESRQFLARIGASPTAEPNAAPLVAVVLSRIILEFYGGSLEIASSEPGFIARLPVTA